MVHTLFGSDAGNAIHSVAESKVHSERRIGGGRRVEDLDSGREGNSLFESEIRKGEVQVTQALNGPVRTR